MNYISVMNSILGRQVSKASTEYISLADRKQIAFESKTLRENQVFELAARETYIELVAKEDKAPETPDGRRIREECRQMRTGLRAVLTRLDRQAVQIEKAKEK